MGALGSYEPAPFLLEEPDEAEEELLPVGLGVGGWVCFADLAGLGTLDDLLRVGLVELVADGLVGGGGLNTGATTNVVNLGQTDSEHAVSERQKRC